MRPSKRSGSTPRYRALSTALLLGLCLSNAVCLAGCKCKSDERASDTATSIEPVVAKAPAGLLAEIRIANPASGWPALREISGLDVLPKSPEILLTGFLDLPPIVAGHFDANAPIGGVVLQRQDQLEAVFSLQLKSERELIAALTTGSDATFTAEARPNGITVLQRKGTPGELSLAAYRGRLVVGKDPSLLLESAPYLAADTGKATNDGAPFELRVAHPVLAEKLGPYLRGAWSRYSSELIDAEQAQISQHGRAADLADPKAVIVGLSSFVESIVAFLESAEALRFTAIPEAERLTVSVEVEPGKEGTAREFLSSLSSGGLGEMASLPGQTKAVLASYDADQPADRFAARAAAGFTTLFGQRLRKQDHDQISNVFADLAKGFASPTLYGSLESGEVSAFFIKSRVEDREAFQRGLSGFAALSQLPALGNLFDNTIGGVKPLPKKWDAATLGGPGAGVTFRIGGTKGIPKEESSLVWFEHAGFGYVVFSENPLPFLAELREPKQGLGSVPEASKLLDFGAERASFAALMRTDSDSSTLSGSSLAFGWDGSSGRLRLRASRAPVRELVALLQKLGDSDEAP